MKSTLATCALLALCVILPAQPGEQTPRLVLQTGHFDRIVSIAYSSDGKLLASGDYDGWIVVWSTDKGDQLRAWKAHARSVASLVFGSGDTTLFSGSWDGTVRMWNPATGESLSEPLVAHHGDGIDSLALNTRAGILVTGSNQCVKDTSIQVWSVAKTNLVHLGAMGNGSTGVSSLSFSGDGTQLVTGEHNHTVKLWDTSNLRNLVAALPLRTFNYDTSGAGYASSTEVSSVAITSDGQWIAGAGGGGSAPVVLWHRVDRDTYEQQKLTTGDGWISSLAFSPDGQWLAAGTDRRGNAVHLWNLKTHKERVLSTESFDPVHPKDTGVYALAFSQDGLQFASGGSDQAITIRNAKAWDEQPRILRHHVRRITALALSPDGRLLASAGREEDFNQGDIRLWDLSDQTALRQISGDYPAVVALAFSSKNNLLASAHMSPDRAVGDNAAAHDCEIRLWNTATGKQVGPTIGVSRIGQGLAPPIGYLVFSNDGKLLANGGENGTIRVWHVIPGDVPSLGELTELPVQRDAVQSMAFLDDDLLAVATRSDLRIQLWKITTRQLQIIGTDDDTGHSVTSLDVSPNHALLASGTTDGRVQLWNKRGKNLMTWSVSAKDANGEPGHSDQAINSVVFLPDGKRLASGSQDGTINVWSVESKNPQPLLHLTNDTGEPVNAIVANNAMLWSSSQDPQIRLWDIARQDNSAKQETGAQRNSNNSPLARLVPLDERGWAIVDFEGRFDSDNLEEIAGLRWVFPDQPLRALPLEIFMRDYYERGLLQRRIECTGKKEDPYACTREFEILPPLAQLNRVQPVVKIVGMRRGASADEVLVDTEAQMSADTSEPNGKTTTEAYDLRLFRNGQLVGQWPIPTAAMGGQEDLQSWQLHSKVPSPTHTFRVRLASKDRGRLVNFTAYAFNTERVKSETVRASYTVPSDISVRQPKAYVLTIGIDGYENPNYKLEFAVKDARDMASALRRIEGYEVVPVSLVSEAGTSPRLNQATKANIRALIALLAGSPINGETLADVVNVDRLPKATPDDLVILFFSGHGHTEHNGAFYLLPSDSGSEDIITDATLKKFISSQELSEWLREVDAGQMAMIIDACHSAASVQAPGIKLGPMGDRGLGQLAYDKGMQILAASRADDVAVEIRDLHHGLLTYALIEDGLSPEKNGMLHADLNDDGEVTLAEWLKYGERRTPALYAEVRAGNAPTVPLRAQSVPPRNKLVKPKDSVPNPKFPDATSKRVQTPSFFDFHKQSDEVVLHRAARQR